MAHRMAKASERDAAEAAAQLQKVKDELIAMMQLVQQKQQQGLTAKDLKPDSFNSKDKVPRAIGRARSQELHDTYIFFRTRK